MLAEGRAIVHHTILSAAKWWVRRNITETVSEYPLDQYTSKVQTWATLLAYHYFIDQAPKTDKISCIPGRLRVSSGDTSCASSLRPYIDEIYSAIVYHPDRQMQQIVPKDNRDILFEAMAVRPSENGHLVPGVHLSALYARETVQAIENFLS